MVVIADSSKRVARLGAFPLPVEVVPFGLRATLGHLERASAALGLVGTFAVRHRNGEVFVSDGGHFIVDCAFGAIADSEGLARALEGIPGVVEHGLFIGIACAAIIAGADGIETIGDLT
jgi:ribose 5-phosphate isomerase A